MLTLAAGLLEVAIAALIVRNVYGRARVFPWLVALATFFLLRGATRLAQAVGVAGGSAWAAVDAAVVIVLGALVVGTEAISRLRLALEDAERTRDEYARALHDYRVLVRHRLATPITTIRGSAGALSDINSLSDDASRALVAAIERAAMELERIALDPHRLRPEELRLRPTPDVRPSRRSVHGEQQHLELSDRLDVRGDQRWTGSGNALKDDGVRS